MKASSKLAIVFMLLASTLVSLSNVHPVHATTPEFVPGTFWANTARTGLTAPSVAFGNNTFVLGGNGSTVSNFIATTTDGEVFTNRKTLNWTITSYQRISNEVTITTAADHLLSLGERFSFTDASLNTALGSSGCTCAVTSTPTANSFTFQLAGSDLPLTSGSWANDRRSSVGAAATVFGGPTGSEVFLVGMNSGFNRVFRSSDNGVTWSVVVFAIGAGDRSNAVWASATYGDGKFVALTDSATHRVIYSSDSGSTWQTATVPAADQSTTWQSVTYGGGKFVAVARAVTTGTNRVMTSTDGVTWTSSPAATGGEANSWQRVAYGDGVFMAVASTGTDRVMTSTDGVTWTARSIPAYPTAVWASVTWAGTAFVLGASPISGNSLVVSTQDNGTTWMPLTDAIGGSGALNNATLSAAVWNGTFLLGVPNETTKPISKSVSPGVPTVSVRTPTNGSSAGGTSVTFTGNGLRAATSVTVDGVAAPITARGGALTLLTQTTNNSTVTVTMPAGTAGGLRNVVIETLGGSVESTFTYNWSNPTLSGTVSGTGSALGGTSVTLTGTNLNGASAVTLGSNASVATENIVNVSSYTVSGTTGVTAIVPPRPCGQVATDWFFRVTTPGGTTAGSANQKFTYSSASSPGVNAVSSATGLSVGGESVVITGSNFVCVSAVQFGTQPATSFVVNSATQITAVTPAGSDGSASISVTTDAGTDSNSSLFSYVSALVTPQSQQSAGTAGSAITPSTAFTPANFTGAVSYAVTTGALPAGLSLNSTTGVVSGTPTAASTTTVTITATGATAGTATATITFAIVAAPTVAPSTQTVSGTAGTAITPSTAFTPANFTGAVSYAVTTGTLPAGLSLSSSTGVASGTPTATSTATVTITATGATAGTATATITFAIVAAAVAPTPAPVAPVVTTPTTVPVAPVVTTPTTVAPVAPTTTLPAAPELVTSANQARLEAAPGEATAIVNGKVVAVETIKVDAAATNEELEATGQNIVDILSDLTPSGEVNPVKLVTKSDGPVLTGLIVNPDDPTEKLDAPVESVTLVRTGDTAVLISAVNQTNLPSAIAPSGAIEVTRGGVLAARSYGLPSLETGEIVLMSTPRLLQKFTVDQSGSYSGQVVLPRKIALGSHTVVMATSKVKVSLGITLVATKLMFRTKTVIGTKLFQSRAGVKKVGGVVTVKGAGRCKAKLNKITMSKKPGRCFITVKQAAKGSNKAVFSRFTVAVVTKVPKAKKK